MNDLEFAFRQLAEEPGFTAGRVDARVGIGANTAVFSSSTPFCCDRCIQEPERLVMVFENSCYGGRSFVIRHCPEPPHVAATEL